MSDHSAESDKNGDPADDGFQDLVAPDALIGRVINEKYKIVSRIGAGGMGTVYRGEDIYIGRNIAIKFLKSGLLENSEYLERFKREAMIASRLNHPNAIMMFDHGVYESSPYLVMQFVDGVTLKEMLVQTGALPLARVDNILKQVGAALAEAHSMGVVHRDLKPDNIMLSSKGNSLETARILDFGIAKPLSIFGGAPGQDLTRAGVYMGTPLYMSPEQALDRPCDERSDIYALGIILYEMITGEVPFRSASPVELLVRHINDIPIPIREFRPEVGVPPEISDVVAKALEKEPEKRFQSISDLVDAFSAATGSLKRSGKSSVSKSRVVARETGVAGETGRIKTELPDLRPPVQSVEKAPPAGPMKPFDHPQARKKIPALIASLSAAALIGAAALAYKNMNQSTPVILQVQSADSNPAVPQTGDDQIKQASGPIAVVQNVAESSIAPQPGLEEPKAKESEPVAAVVLENAGPPAVSSDSRAALEPAPESLDRLQPEEIKPAPEEVKTEPAVNEELLASIEALNTPKPEETTSNSLDLNPKEAAVEPGAAVPAPAAEQTLESKYSLVQVQAEISARPNKDERKLSDKLYGEGQKYFDQGQYSEAAEQFKSSLVACEANLGARLSLGSTLLRLGAPELAFEHFKAAEAENRDYPPTLYGFASYYAVKNDPQKSVDYLKRAITLYSKIKTWPKDDADFDPIRNDPGFQELIGK